MSFSQYDVVVVGAGCAGLTAAIGLGRAGFTVALVEAAPHPGAENGAGGVYFTENLAQPDLLGPDGVEALAWERRLIEHGSFATDGRRLLGRTYRDPEAFRNCYTVLRPIYDLHLAQAARRHDVTLLSATTAETLIRDGRRVVGITTQRGPLYADLVFLAEGAAGHLVTREGYHHPTEPRHPPLLLLSLMHVVDLPPGTIEERFGVGPEQGVAIDLLVRNPVHRDRTLPLNLRGLVCTNRQSLTVSVLAPLAPLQEHFANEPQKLLEWFEGLPALEPWWRDGRRSAFAARLIRGGGMRDMPYLIDDGLAIGGSVAGLSIDLPLLNHTGPATATGLLLSRAAQRIRATGGDFRHDELRRHYLEPLQQTRYWRDAELLIRWPHYIQRTPVLFAGGLDLLLDSAAIWTHPRRWLPGKLLRWLALLARTGPSQWRTQWSDLVTAGKSLRLREIAVRPALARLVLDGALNAFRDLVRQPRAHLPPGGTVRIHYRSADDAATEAKIPIVVRRWFNRFRLVSASAGRLIYRNDETPLHSRLTATSQLLGRQINLFDVLGAAAFATFTLVATLLLTAARWLLGLRKEEEGANEMRTDAASIPTEGGGMALASPVYEAGRTSHIHLVWKPVIRERGRDSAVQVPPVCPAGVFEVQPEIERPPRLAVRHEKCIKCEACWRANRAVDWGRDGRQEVIYPFLSPVLIRLLEAEDHAGFLRPRGPRRLDPWEPVGEEMPPRLEERERRQLCRLLDQLEHKLDEFDTILRIGPQTVFPAHSDHLEMLARYAQQLALSALEILRKGDRADAPDGTPERVRELAAALTAKLEERTQRTWNGRFAWAAADGRQIRQHHLVGLRRLLGLSAAPPDGGRPHTGGQRTIDSSYQPLLEMARLAGNDDLASVATRTAVVRLFAEIASRCLLRQTLRGTQSSGGVRGDLLGAMIDELHHDMETEAAELAVITGGQEKLTIPSTPRATGAPSTVCGLEIYRVQGASLLASPDSLSELLAVDGDWQTLIQRRALQPELEEIRRVEARLAGLARSWQDTGSLDERTRSELAAGFARQAAHVLAGKLVLLAIHDRLEAGRDVELDVALLRVWLDAVAALSDEFALLVQCRRRPSLPPERPLVEPGSPPPSRKLQDFLAAPAPYRSGDFLLLPVDLLQPRLVPEMVAGHADFDTLLTTKEPLLPGTKTDPPSSLAEVWQIVSALRADQPAQEENRFLLETLAVEILGRCARQPVHSFTLETAITRLIAARLEQRNPGLNRETNVTGEKRPPILTPVLDHCAILQGLIAEVLPRCPSTGETVGVRHLQREVLELEALKRDFRRRLLGLGRVLGAEAGWNHLMQASCFALAEAAAWLKAADSLLGRLAWVSQLSYAEDQEEPDRQQDLGRRLLARCCGEVRDRLHRFDEDLSAMRRGYLAPHLRAAELLHQTQPSATKARLTSSIQRPLRLLVVVEPEPALLATEDGDRALEAYWALTAADRAALENALRLRDDAPDLVTVEVLAFGPPRVVPRLQEILGRGIERVRLFDGDNTAMAPEQTAAALAPVLASADPFDLLLGGEGPHREKRLLALVADAAGLTVSGRAAQVRVLVRATAAHVQLLGDGAAPLRERALPTAVAIEPGLSLRPFRIAGYLAGLAREVEGVAR
jgi:electron transfer flavoprotein-quinone oxidoreductase